MKSIRARLEGLGDEFLRDVELWGVWHAMDKYGFRNYIAVKKYIGEETGNESFGLYPQLTTIDGKSNSNPFEVFIQKFADYVVRKETEIKRKDERIELLEKRLAYYEKQDMAVVEDNLVSVIEACEG